MTEVWNQLAPETAARYLRERDELASGVEATVRPLGGGVSNTVIEVIWDGDCLVLKQPLANLAVEDDWSADVSRVHNEAAAARAYRRLVGQDDRVAASTPAVRLEDDVNHVIGLDCAPSNASMWKRELLDGRVDLSVARTLGEALGTVHNRAATDTQLRERFHDPTPFDQLRLDPYHRTTADRHPDIADAILAETDRVASVDRTLVHGDYSPKNVLVDRTGHTPESWLIDFEVAHWGDPAFDVAFMCNHLFIKSLYRADARVRLLEAVDVLWEAYQAHVPWDIDAHVAAELGVLILARIDGKSPVEYVDEGPVADAMRRVGTRAIRSGVDSIHDFAAIVREEAP